MKMENPALVELDGAAGEGGGQILRSALTLAMITGRPFVIRRIRAGRARPGLLRQHLTAVQAAAAICAAQVEGAELGSTQLRFDPGAVRAGNYRFAIGSAGSAALVLQTVLPALWLAGAASCVSVSGGTHNQSAPPFEFLAQAWTPLLARMGVKQTLSLLRHGFYPAGGGEIIAHVEPVAGLQGISLLERGPLQDMHAEALVAGVPYKVALRELESVLAAFPAAGQTVIELPMEQGPGNALLLRVVHEVGCEVFCGFGERGVSAERIANGVVQAARRYLASPAVVDAHLADQLLLPMALAGAGEFTATEASAHLLSNKAVIEAFLPVSIALSQCQAAVHVRVCASG
ncbi:RNA 3'-terminal phosphate cyclase [Chitinilyticum aquatile]|uniref:RNA 3'-terminal phosphate cyclase n=1 Tax=Chitinilyticum aquatile TaxID=362520 RepID=UPI00040F18AE|nr:RNA 3'-terminal phosphate cyclase [Chitinilyticum aquatile]